MKIKKSTLSVAMGLAIGGASLTAQAALTSSAVLVIDSGQLICTIGGTIPNCTYGAVDVTAGSWFSMDANGDGIVAGFETWPIVGSGGVASTKGKGLSIHRTFDNTGNPMNSHAGFINGTENPQFDIWEFFGQTGMHYLSSPMTDLGTDTNGNHLIDMSGWALTWNEIETIPIGGDATNFPADTGVGIMACSSPSCSFSSTFTLTYSAHVPVNDPSLIGGVAYALTLTGGIAQAGGIVPIPASAWLFGSGLVGLVGIARRKTKNQG